MFCVLESAKTEAKNSGRMNEVIPVVTCIDRVKCGSTSAMAKSTSRDFSHSGFVAAKVCVRGRTLSWKFACHTFVHPWKELHGASWDSYKCIDCKMDNTNVTYCKLHKHGK